MLNVRIDSNIEAVVRLLSETGKKHVPYALSYAINRAGFQARLAVQKTTPDRFTLRNERIVKGIRYQKATPKSLEARIYTLDWYMRDQEEGGDREPRAARSIWVTARNRHKDLYPVRTGRVWAGLVSTSMRPKRLYQAAVKSGTAYPKNRRSKTNPKDYAKPKPFRRKKGIYIRESEEPDSEVYKLYSLQQRVRLKKRWFFGETASKSSRANLYPYFLEALDHAFSNAKAKKIPDAADMRLLETLMGQPESPSGLMDTLRQNGRARFSSSPGLLDILRQNGAGSTGGR